MAQAMIPIWSTTLSATASQVTMGGLPQTYRDLRLIVNATGTASANIGIYVNGDTGSNYAQMNMRGYSTTSTGSSSTTVTQIQSNFNTGLTTGEYAINTYDLLEYAQTDKQKPILIRANHSGEVDAIAGRWASSAAITSITITSGTTFAIGSMFTLYGIVG